MEADMQPKFDVTNSTTIQRCNCSTDKTTGWDLALTTRDLWGTWNTWEAKHKKIIATQTFVDLGRFLSHDPCHKQMASSYGTRGRALQVMWLRPQHPPYTSRSNVQTASAQAPERLFGGGGVLGFTCVGGCWGATSHIQKPNKQQIGMSVNFYKLQLQNTSEVWETRP